jgi:hypothetical protein
VTLEFHSTDGQTFGRDAHHHPVSTAPGLELAGAGDTATYLVPAGSYTVSLLGTGKGRATVEIGSVHGRTSRVEVFSFAARAGATGTLTVSAAKPPTKAAFGGKRVVGVAGEGLVLHGMPATVTAGHASVLRLSVVDQFGRPVNGATVIVTGAQPGRGGVTDERGRVTLTITPSGRKITVAATAPGARRTTVSARVR